jgi:Tfp pilus assembly protein PilF
VSKQRGYVIISLLSSFRLFAAQSGAYKTALAQFESILSDILARYGEHHDRVGAALHNVAIANLRAGSLDDAMDAIEEAIKIRSRSLGRSHPKVAVRLYTPLFL